MTRDLFWGNGEAAHPMTPLACRRGRFGVGVIAKKRDKNERLIWGRQREREGEGVK